MLRHQLTPAARSPYQNDCAAIHNCEPIQGQHCTEERKQDEYRHNDLPRTHDIDHASAKRDWKRCLRCPRGREGIPERPRCLRSYDQKTTAENKCRQWKMPLRASIVVASVRTTRHPERPQAFCQGDFRRQRHFRQENSNTGNRQGSKRGDKSHGPAPIAQPANDGPIGWCPMPWRL